MTGQDFEPFTYTVSAQITEPTDDDYEEIIQASQGFIIASSQGGLKPFGPDGRPRMLVISAWMAHEGRNLNGDAFVKEELQDVVKNGLFAPPYAGMIDDDHDFTARGYWYKTSFARDPVANKWGVLATGAIWAWRYADLADRLLTDMSNRGLIDVSMSVIAGHTEVTLGFPGSKGERTKVLHNPVFFTTSLLSVPPGDKFARGKVAENPGPDEVSNLSKEIAMAETKELVTAAETSFADPILPQPGDWQIQSLIFPKTHWERADICAAWANNHGFLSDDMTETPGGFVFHQRSPDLFVSGSWKVQCVLGTDRDQPYDSMCRVKAVIGNRNVNPLDGPAESYSNPDIGIKTPE